jgi:hypothetical protein
MLRKDPEKRYASMDEVAAELWAIHGALRRSRSRSALPPRAENEPLVSEEARSKVREHLARGRAHAVGGRVDDAARELGEALAIDPDCAEAAEALWNCGRLQPPPEKPAPPSRNPDSAARIDALLARISPDQSEAEVRRALAELALVAPDEPRLLDLLRERSGRFKEV